MTRRGDHFSWEAAEMQLGTLPTDLKSLVDTFGDGKFDGFIFLLVPVPVNEFTDIVESTTAFNQQFQPPQTNEPFENLHEEYDAGLLQPWAKTDNGDLLALVKNSADPERWPVAVLESRGFRWQVGVSLRSCVRAEAPDDRGVSGRHCRLAGRVRTEVISTQ